MLRLIQTNTLLNLSLCIGAQMRFSCIVYFQSEFLYLYYRLQGKSQIVQDELLKLGDQILENTEGTKALALQLCREFEDKFLQHITGGEVSCFFSSGTCIIFY